MAVVHDLVVEPQSRPLVGSVPVPGDEAIACLLLLAASWPTGRARSVDFRRLATRWPCSEALRALGVSIDLEAKGKASVKGVGLRGLSAQDAVDCGGSARAMRLLASVLVAHPFETVLRGDASLLGTSMVGLVGALRGRGARMEGAFSTTDAAR